MQTSFSLAQLADPNIAEAEKILRTCVHCGFCTATCPTFVLLRRRARQPARADLPDQGHAGERQAGERRGGQAYRPLPVLPLLHDDLPVGGPLHASGGPRAKTYRGDLRAAAGRTLAAQAAGGHAAQSGAVPARPARRLVRQALCAAVRGAARHPWPTSGAMLRLAPAAVPTPSWMDRPQVFAAEGRAGGPGSR